MAIGIFLTRVTWSLYYKMKRKLALILVRSLVESPKPANGVLIIKHELEMGSKSLRWQKFVFELLQNVKKVMYSIYVSSLSDELQTQFCL